VETDIFAELNKKKRRNRNLYLSLDAKHTIHKQPDFDMQEFVDQPLILQSDADPVQSSEVFKRPRADFN